MAIGAFPLAKLGFVLVKQISKPIANGIANRARKSKLFRNYICIPVISLVRCESADESSEPRKSFERSKIR